MFSRWVLGLWTATGILWWLVAWWLVAMEKKVLFQGVPKEEPREFLSIFKPLPLLAAGDLDLLTPGLESFISQLNHGSELLLGIHEADRGEVASFLNQMRTRYPEAQLKTIFRAEADQVANPKIAWQMVLASLARGELWMWSDADIVAPAGFLPNALDEYLRCGAAMLTFPYVVRDFPTGPAILDALFVNAEFYPGVLLLRRFGPVDFGLGAGMLFRRDDFLRKVNFVELGSALADDFLLGQRLGPAQVSSTTFSTIGDPCSWKESLQHNLRWSKTVWWNRPISSAARIVVLPVTGWIACVILHPAQVWAWAGLIAMVQMDVISAGAVCWRLGCSWRARDLLTLEWWSVWRVAVWLACWFPWSVVWRGQVWLGPKTALTKESLRTRH